MAGATNDRPEPGTGLFLDWMNAGYPPPGTDAYRTFLAEREADPSSKPTRAAEIRGLSYRDLLEDRQLLDRVARAVSLNTGCEYVEALDQLSRWNSRVSVDPTYDATVAEVLDKGPSALDRVCSDVIAMEQAEVAVADAAIVFLDSCDPEARVSLDDVDDSGQVALLDGVDRAKLLTDPYIRERAWLRAKELDQRGLYTADVDLGDGLDARGRFDRDYRQNIEDGVDLVATMDAAHRAEVAQEESLADRSKQVQREALEREKRAERRELEAQAAETQDRLRRL